MLSSLWAKLGGLQAVITLLTQIQCVGETSPMKACCLGLFAMGLSVGRLKAIRLGIALQIVSQIAGLPVSLAASTENGPVRSSRSFLDPTKSAIVLSMAGADGIDTTSSKCGSADESRLVKLMMDMKQRCLKDMIVFVVESVEHRVESAPLDETNIFKAHRSGLEAKLNSFKRLEMFE
jgi:hypothetical protein